MGDYVSPDEQQLNATALDMAIRSIQCDDADAIVAAATKYRHFILTGKVLIPPQPEQPE